MDSHPTSEYLAWSKLPGHFVVVYVVNKKVAALHHMFVDTDQATGQPFLTLDMLAVDKKYQNKKIGTVFLILAEELAVQLGLSETRLEALNQRLVSTYRNFGYENNGPPYTDPVWRELFPMRKRLPT